MSGFETGGAEETGTTLGGEVCDEVAHAFKTMQAIATARI
jgi:hypothetical protein